jgi:hypothetical protein
MHVRDAFVGIIAGSHDVKVIVSMFNCGAMTNRITHYRYCMQGSVPVASFSGVCRVRFQMVETSVVHQMASFFRRGRKNYCCNFHLLS